MLTPYIPIDDAHQVNPSYLATQIQTHGAALFHDQEFTESSYAEFMRQFGECEKPELFMNSKENPEVFYVTGKRDPEGQKIGMFGDGELGWHSNGNSRHKIDKILIALYCVEEDVNTTLSVCHTSHPFYHLSQDEQEYWRNIKIRIKFQNNTMYDLEEDDPELEFMSANKGSIRTLVGRHPHTGEEYFYFPYHFIIGAWEGKKKIDVEPMIEKLKKIIFKSEHQFHHVFRKGDLLLMDQFTTLHRRSPVLNSNRLLWRVACDYQFVSTTV